MYMCVHIAYPEDEDLNYSFWEKLLESQAKIFFRNEVAGGPWPDTVVGSENPGEKTCIFFGLVEVDMFLLIVVS